MVVLKSALLVTILYIGAAQLVCHFFGLRTPFELARGLLPEPESDAITEEDLAGLADEPLGPSYEDLQARVAELESELEEERKLYKRAENRIHELDTEVMSAKHANLFHAVLFAVDDAPSDHAVVLNAFTWASFFYGVSQRPCRHIIAGLSSRTVSPTQYPTQPFTFDGQPMRVEPDQVLPICFAAMENGDEDTYDREQYERDRQATLDKLGAFVDEQQRQAVAGMRNVSRVEMQGMGLYTSPSLLTQRPDPLMVKGPFGKLHKFSTIQAVIGM